MRVRLTAQVYEELDESLTKAFEDYLRERGVDEALGAYLVEAVHDKEQREYQVCWIDCTSARLYRIDNNVTVIVVLYLPFFESWYIQISWLGVSHGDLMCTGLA